MARNQLDLFGAEEPDLFDEDAPAPVFRPDVDKVRAELLDILAQARAAQTLPWDHRQTNLYRTIVPQMSLWLPEDEARQLCFEFETELARLEAA